MSDNIAYISVGSNIGDKLANCKNGIYLIEKTGTGEIISRSKFYYTEPVEFKKQEWFVNGVVKLSTNLAPHELLAGLKKIEQELGREKTIIRFGPRILDLDIILYNNMIIKSKNLIIPHPEMHKRRFVLKPLCDIQENIIHPVLKKDMVSLFGLIDDQAQKLTEYK